MRQNDPRDERIRFDASCDLKVDVVAPIEMGDAPWGRRLIIPILGGTVSGEPINRHILNLGAG